LNSKVIIGFGKGAFDLILCSREGEVQDAAKAARRKWDDTRDAHATLSILPNNLYIERRLLQRYLELDCKDYLGAINGLDRNLRLMYVHSYQSLLWNKVATHRLESLGRQVVEGDLVLEVDFVEQEEPNLDTYSLPPVRCVSKSEIAEGKYTLKDVVLPLPGRMVKYPENGMKEKFQELMAEDGLDIDDMTRGVKDFSLPGGYRKLVTHPGDLSWECLRYNETVRTALSIPLHDDHEIIPVPIQTEPLVQTDLDTLRGRTVPDRAAEARQSGKEMAVSLSFTLPSASYATMLLRELMCSTSAEMSGKV
tara:strand:- start:428 stop:1351 length:924 start_codon:yes stop_codon:yes gene_type:complete